MLPDEAQELPKIRAFLKPQIDEMERLMPVVLSVLPGPGVTIKKADVDKTVAVCGAGLLVKAVKTFRAVKVVCETGLGQDGVALIRVLFETTVAAEFVLRRNSRLRARMFLAYPCVTQLRTLRTWRQTKGFKRHATKKLEAKATANLRIVVGGLAELRRWPAKHPYGTELPRRTSALAQAIKSGTGVDAAENAAVAALVETLKKHWCGKSLEEATKMVKLHAAYQTLYRYASPTSHAADVQDHVEIHPNGALTLRLIPGADRNTVRTMETASFCLWCIGRALNRRFGLGKDAELEAVRPRMGLRLKRP